MPEQNDDQASSLEKWIIDSRNGDNAALNRLAEYLLPKAFEFASWKMLNLSPVDDFEDVAVSAVKSICLRFRHGEREFLGESELVSLLRQFVTGKIRDRHKYHSAEKRDIKLNVSESDSNAGLAVLTHAMEDAESVWLDELSLHLPIEEQTYLSEMLENLGADVQGLFAELVKRLDEKPRKVLILITTGNLSNAELAEKLDCAPVSIERYRKAIRRKLEEIVSE